MHTIEETRRTRDGGCPAGLGLHGRRTICPPCHGDCDQGRSCPQVLAEKLAAHQDRLEALQARRHDRRQTRRDAMGFLLGMAAVFAASMALFALLDTLEPLLEPVASVVAGPAR